jgi:hypothetical protein
MFKVNKGLKLSNKNIEIARPLLQGTLLQRSPSDQPTGFRRRGSWVLNRICARCLGLYWQGRGMG